MFFLENRLRLVEELTTLKVTVGLRRKCESVEDNKLLQLIKINTSTYNISVFSSWSLKKRTHTQVH